jgi:putative ABC transport system ATP-binding protein
MSSAVRAHNLKFSYSAETPVLDIENFTVNEGEIVFLYGPSGSGKSTLLELLAGVLKLNSGELHVCGQQLEKLSLAGLDSYRAREIGYIFQSFNLIPYLSVLENIELPFLFQKDEIDEKLLHSLLERLGLSHYVQRPVAQLSVGQQQRVAVARALLKKPKLILADEPTSALDYNHRENFLKILFELCRQSKTSVVFVSHDRTIEKLFDRSVSLAEINKVKSPALLQAGELAGMAAAGAVGAGVGGGASKAGKAGES